MMALERAAFLLHDVFGHPLNDVAETIGRIDGPPQTARLDIVDRQIVAIYIMRNPDMLARLARHPRNGMSAVLEILVPRHPAAG
ncbi:hypothetical protein KCX83_16140 [Brucella oryzae]|uniref:hypothetical protein n=1 Tax=Brucella oryzae TaxID=335286 RepID=UPI001B822759|nr:hypothetical protein [Brucella oryzae]